MNDVDHKFVNARLDALHSDIADMKAALRDLSAAITKLALVEERLVQTSSSIDRAFKFAEKISERVAVLEKTGVDSMRVSRWVDRTVWAVVAAVGIYIAKQSKLL